MRRELYKDFEKAVEVAKKKNSVYASKFCPLYRGPCNFACVAFELARPEEIYQSPPIEYSKWEIMGEGCTAPSLVKP